MINYLNVDNVDVQSNRKLLSELLRRKGVDSDMAEDGVKALEIIALKPAKYDIVFMDNTMPRMVSKNMN